MSELVDCPVCHENRHELHLRTVDRFAMDPVASFTLVKCVRCGMIRLSPRPLESESETYYQHAEYLPFSSMERQDSMMEMAYKFGRRMNLRWKRKLIDRYWRGSTARSPGRLLDVGCGTGEFMGVMKRVGWYVQGMERNREAVQWAGKTWGVPVYAGNLAEFHPEKPFDVITLWHVLEHLYDPVQALNHLKGLLTIDGFFLVAVPNAGGVDAGLYGSNWVALDTPRHVNHFSARTLAQLFRAIGLEIVLRRQLPFDAPFNALLSEQLSARRVRSSGFSWPFRLCRAGLIAMGSLAGGSRVFSARFGASLVFLARRTANMP